MKYLLLLLLFFLPQAHAAEPGEIVAISKDGNLRFYSGEYVLLIGEKLRVTDSYGNSNRYIEVTRVDPPYAEAKFDAFVVGQNGGMVEAFKVGQKVKLDVEQRELKSVSFFAGPNSASKHGAFGGTNYFLGLSVEGYIKKDLVWNLLVQADSLGKDGSDTEVRRASYMIGGGFEWQQFQVLADVGLIDTMTIISGAPSPTYIDPYSGTAYVINGTQHKTKGGFLLLANRRFELSRVSRGNKFGWSLSPRVSYGNTFSSTPYGGFVSYGLSIDLWFD